MKHVVHAACPHDCPDACGVLITVEDGRATRIQGDPEHPVTRGFLCAKVAKYLGRVYSPDRVLYPMRRVAPKGTRVHDFSAFKRISWDEALEVITAKFKSIADEFGSEAILPYSYGGTLGTLNSGSMDRRFFHRLGASQLDRTICSAAGEAGILSVLGAKYGTEPEQFAHSRYIIAWGANIHGNNVHLWPFITEARRKGAKLVVIDPYLTRTAQCADWYIPIRPGTDVALALGLMHVIIRDGLHDADYIAKHTTGFEQLKQRVAEYTPEKVSAWTGMPAEDIVRLAREYATTSPAAIRVNYGVQRSENGGTAVRVISMLPCLTGSWRHIGGGLQLSLSGAFQLDRESLKRTDLMQTALGRPARVINMVELGRALTELNEPPVKALFVYASNPAAVCPDHHRVLAGLKRPDLFTVVHEQFLTDTCDYADIVLPATTFFEHKDLQTAYGTYYLQISNAAIAPVGESRSNVALFRALAERMGFTEECFRESEDEMIDAALASGHAWMQGITRERLEREKHVRLNLPAYEMKSKVAAVGIPTSANNGQTWGTEGSTPTSPRSGQMWGTEVAEGGPNWFLPFAEGSFPTTSGKAEFYTPSLETFGLDPVAAFVPPQESRHSADARYPLELLARKADNFLNSTFCNLPGHQSLEEGNMGVLEMTPADASARGIRNGEAVRVFNSRGEVRLVARIGSTVPQGVVACRLDWAKNTNGSVSINVLTSDRLTDMGRGATFYSTLVEVEKGDL